MSKQNTFLRFFALTVMVALIAFVKVEATFAQSSPIELLYPSPDEVQVLDAFGWSFSWRVPTDCTTFARIYTPDGQILDSLGWNEMDFAGGDLFSLDLDDVDDPDDAVDPSAFLSYPFSVSEELSFWYWQVLAACPDGEYETERQLIWVEAFPEFARPIEEQDRIGARVITGTVYAPDGMGGVAPAENATVDCTHISQYVPKCHPESITTGVDGTFSFELIAHLSDEITIAADNTTLIDAQAVDVTACTEQCPEMTLNLTSPPPTHVQLSEHTSAPLSTYTLMNIGIVLISIVCTLIAFQRVTRNRFDSVP